MKRIFIIILTLVPLLIGCGTESETPEKEPETFSQSAEVVGQGFEGATVSGAEANIFRTQNNGFFVDLSKPAPQPGSYDYPENAEQGDPEVFTLWIFVFNDPDSDQFDAAYLGSAYVADDLNQNIELNGHITQGTAPFTGEGTLEDAMNAYIRLTVAPHGQLDADKLPGQLTTPSGGPDYWWIAEFESPDF